MIRRVTTPITLSLLPGDKEKLIEIAYRFGCLHGASANISYLISLIASEELKLYDPAKSPAPTTPENDG
jgi:hypothetical protein